METQNKNMPDNQPPQFSGHNRRGRVMGGLFIVAVGVLLLAKQAGVLFPPWLFSFEMLLIALGLYLGFRHSFRGFAWMIPVLIGAFLLIEDFFPYYDIKHFIWPIVIIAIGLFMTFRGGKKTPDWKKWESSQGEAEADADDYLDLVVVFGGMKKNVIAKNFRGGESVTVFGGTEINLSQADLNGPIVLELTQIFGGTKLIIPAHWRVQSTDLVAIFGGIDDKRPPASNSPEESEKVLILKGTCLLGGIELKSY